jgi:hypothetical protein
VNHIDVMFAHRILRAIHNALPFAVGGIVLAASTLTAQARPMLAKGTFEVKMVPQADADATVGRMTLDKELAGDIVGTSKGMMLASMSAIPNSAGYVAIEKVTGTLHGKRGTFVLQHNATMDRGAQSLNVIVIPDSGTDELTGLTGTFKIIIEGKKHFYEFEYTIKK